MFKKILVAVDGSPTAMLAVNEAISLAGAFDSELTLVNVVDYYPFVGIGADYAFGQTEYMEAATASAKQALAAGAAAVQAAGKTCEQKVVEGEVVHEGILHTARDIGADLVIMGSHGRHGIEKLLLGSVVQRVLSHTTIPVLVMRG